LPGGLFLLAFSSRACAYCSEYTHFAAAKKGHAEHDSQIKQKTYAGVRD
jgi:hypothetical protein